MTKDSYKAIVKDLATTPNRAPTYIYEIPVRDPGGLVVAHRDGTQCLICYKAVPGRSVRHFDSCAYLRAQRILKGGKK